MAMPLEGIKVLDLTLWAFGPLAAEYLAEMGAEVIKIENTEGGEPSRGLDSLKWLPIGKYNAYFEQTHRGKRSLALNLRHEEGREVARKLVKNTDIFVTNFRLGGLERMGMDYATLSQINPRLIYALGTGWGLKGPARDRGAFEGVGLAGAGLMSTWGPPHLPPPTCPPMSGDYTASTLLAYGIMLALFHRERTGEGQMVHVSLLGTFMKIGSGCIDVSLAAKQDMFGVPHNMEQPLYNCYQTKDKRWMHMAVQLNEPAWAKFCQAMSIEHLRDDPRFNSHQARLDNKETLIAILDEIFLTKTRDEWVKHLEQFDFPWSPVKHYSELLSDPQVLENGYLQTLNDPEVGEVKVVGVAVDLSKTPGRVRDKAPQLGQHTEEILLELGYAWDDIAALKEQKVII